MIEFYGKIIDTVHYKNKVFIITNKDEDFYLIEFDKVFNLTNIILKCSDLEYLKYKIKKELEK